MAEPLISAVIVTYNSRADIAACLHALQGSDYPCLEMIVVDNASADGTADLVERSFPAVRLVRSGGNLGFGGGNNLAFTQARGDILLVLNPDVRLLPHSLGALAAAFAADAQMGIVGAKLLFPDGRTLQHAGGLVDYPLATTHHLGYGESDGGQYDEASEPPFVTGAALAIRRSAAQVLGGFDAGFFPVYYEDVDLCYRARTAGWRVAYLPTVVGLHRSSASLDPAGETYFRFFHANRLRFVLKHWTTEQLLTDFLPAESARLRGEMPAADRAASLQAYHLLHGRAASDSGSLSRLPESGAATGVKGGGYETRLTSVEGGLAMPATAHEELAPLIGDLETRWVVREQPFRSSLPLVGPLVARLRAAWNDVATRWYVQPMLQQQVEFNGMVVRTLQALARAIEAQEAVSQATPAILAARLAAMEERMDRLETERRDEGMGGQGLSFPKPPNPG